MGLSVTVNFLGFKKKSLNKTRHAETHVKRNTFGQSQQGKAILKVNLLESLNNFVFKL